MKIILVFLAILSPVCSAELLTTRTGEKIEYLKVSRISPDGISLEVENGIQKVPFEKLSDTDRTKYEMTKAGVETFRAKKDLEQQKQNEFSKSVELPKPPTSSSPTIPNKRILINPAPLIQIIQMETASAGGMRKSGEGKPGWRYSEGKWRGKTKEQLVVRK